MIHFIFIASVVHLYMFREARITRNGRFLKTGEKPDVAYIYLKGYEKFL